MYIIGPNPKYKFWYAGIFQRFRLILAILRLKTWKVRGGEAKVAKYKCDIPLDIIIISLIISKFDNYSKLFGTSSCYKTKWTCIRNWNLNKYVLESRVCGSKFFIGGRGGGGRNEKKLYLVKFHEISNCLLNKFQKDGGHSPFGHPVPHSLLESSITLVYYICVLPSWYRYLLFRFHILFWNNWNVVRCGLWGSHT